MIRRTPPPVEISDEQIKKWKERGVWNEESPQWVAYNRLVHGIDSPVRITVPRKRVRKTEGIVNLVIQTDGSLRDALRYYAKNRGLTMKQVVEGWIARDCKDYLY